MALPLLGLAAWAVWTAQGSVRARAAEALLGRVRAIALALERDWERARTVLDTLAASRALARGDLAVFEEEMRAASAVFGGASVTLVSAADGTIALSTLWRPGERRPGIRAPVAARQVLAAGSGEVAANPFQALLTGSPSVAVGVPVFAPADAGSAGEGGGRRVVAGVAGLSFPRDRVAAALRAASDLSEDDARAGRVAAMLDRSGASSRAPAARRGPSVAPRGPRCSPDSRHRGRDSSRASRRLRACPPSPPTHADRSAATTSS